jgi:Ca2+-binding RTX toxin-like protein
MLALAAESFQGSVPAWWQDYLLTSVLYNGGGSTSISDADGTSTLIGTSGDDTFLVSNSATKVQAGEGFDTVRSSVSWVMSDGVEVLELIGSSAINGTGTTADDIITGNSAANILDGRDGNDRLSGSSGNDILNGGTATTH